MTHDDCQAIVDRRDTEARQTRAEAIELGIDWLTPHDGAGRPGPHGKGRLQPFPDTFPYELVKHVRLSPLAGRRREVRRLDETRPLDSSAAGQDLEDTP